MPDVHYQGCAGASRTRLMICLQRTLSGVDQGIWKFTERQDRRWYQGLSPVASQSGNPSARSESAIMEVPTPCARLQVLPSLAARTSQWFAVSTGPYSRYGQRSVKSNMRRFGLGWPATGTSPALQSLDVILCPRNLGQRFRGDGRFHAWRGRSLDSTVDPH